MWAARLLSEHLKTDILSLPLAPLSEHLKTDILSLPLAPSRSTRRQTAHRQTSLSLAPLSEHQETDYTKNRHEQNAEEVEEEGRRVPREALSYIYKETTTTTCSLREIASYSERYIYRGVPSKSCRYKISPVVITEEFLKF